MKSKETKIGSGNTALKAGVWYVISSIMVKAISIITTPIFTRMLSTSEYGTVSTFTSWSGLLLTFFTLNLTYSIGRAKLDYPDKLDDYVGSMQLLSLLVSSVICVIMLAFLKPVSTFMELSESATILLILYLLFTPAINFKQNTFRYRYQYKQNVGIAWYIALSTVICSLALMIMLDGDKALYRIIGITLPTIVLSIFIWICTLKNHNVCYNKEYWKYGWALSGPLILHTVSMNILSQSDRIFISKICGAEATGIYSLAYNYGILLSIVTNAVADGWLPWFHDNYYAKNYADIRKNAKKIVLLGCYVGLACVALAPEAIIILGGKKYLTGIYCVPPVVLGIVCQYIYTHYVNIEMHLKKTKFVSQGTISAAIINIILNAIFIPRFGYIAAAYTTLASYLMLLIVHFLITRRVLKIKLYDDVFMFLAMLVTGCVSVLISITYNYTILRYIVIGLGFVSFLISFRSYLYNMWTKFTKGK
ncbi:lipopolysaccharide biosynthesis protein [uncultured Clostridium sp.]|uniref:lipopolysaccharide biosynthesis protein n=1 Tax=Clostridium sp. AF37-7 TaxID=2293017 RepID=UPI000E53C0DA|nr:oligosaccharide flippase family protein [uncultured Clostridium sp.]RHO90792.1 hypothetical protein DW023_08235 [Clostridium sp. AF37-7]